MSLNMSENFKKEIWKVVIWFIGFFIVFLLDIPITFLTIFIILLLGYIIGGLLKALLGKRMHL